ncbi:MAG TPA: DUF5677 domain-containing protein [Gemmatimonadales bacterium]|nr:DUF5677 domain-containing protein [Gemmatimonadales bacterium]
MTSAQYRKKVLEEFPDAFALWSSVVKVVEPAISGPLPSPSLLHVSLQMLVFQSYNSFATVALLTQHGLLEDAATAARRLMELGVQAAWIGLESDKYIRERRAGMYIAFMWRSLPRNAKSKLSPSLRRGWGRAAQRYGPNVPANAKQWYGNFRAICKDIGAEPMYLEDYSLLSQIAHGASDEQIMRFSRQRVKLRSTQFVPVLLAYSCRYHLMAVAAWNAVHRVIPADAFGQIEKTVIEFDPRVKSSGRW